MERRLLFALTGPYFVDPILEISDTGDLESVISADLDNDGHADLVVQSSFDRAHVFYGRGNGTFGAPVPIGVGLNGPMQTADLNEDGRADVIAYDSQSTGRLRALLSTSTGAFTPVPVDVAPRTTDFVIRDFDGDGHLDLAGIGDSTVPMGGNYLAIGNGDGTFAAPIEFATNLDQPKWVDAGDLDADGIVDLVVANVQASTAPTGIAYLRGLGGGSFASPTWTSTSSPEQFQLTDTNNDGRQDLVGVTSTLITVYFGNGNGTFDRGPFGVGITSPSTTGQSVIVDFNSDAFVDLLLVDVGTIWLLRGLGDGRFAARVSLLSGSGTITDDLTTADFDSDCALDLARVNWPGLSIGLNFGNGAGGLRATPTGSFAGPTYAMASADFNHDGKDDLARAGSGASSVEVALQGANGTFLPPQTFNLNLGGPQYEILAADFNGDSFEDLYASGSARGAVLLNQGDGTFGAPTTLAQTSFGPKRTIDADFDADGLADLLVIVGSQSQILLSNGDGTFHLGSTFASTGIQAVVGDFDSDAVPDIITAPTAASVQLRRGNGDGTFAAPVVINTGLSPQTFTLFSGRFNADETLDLVLAGQNAAAVLRANGDGTFASPVITPTSFFIFQAVSGDFDDDGSLELALPSSDGPVVLNFREDGTLESPAQSAASGTPNLVIVALDYNNDEKLDLTITNSGATGPAPYFLENIGIALAPSTISSRYDVNPHTVLLHFDASIDPSTVQTGDLTVRSSGGGVVAALSVSVLPDGRTVAFELPASMPDGEYRITLAAGTIASTQGVPTSSEVIVPVQTTFVLAGDLNRDRTVNFDDLFTLAQNYGRTGKTFSQGNIDYSADGLVGFDDLLMLAQRYGTSILSSALSGVSKRRSPAAGGILTL